MKGFAGNKTLLPLKPDGSPFQGTHLILAQVLKSLPPGPKALVIHHYKEEVRAATSGLGLIYCEQPVLNGTGGALLAARPFIELQEEGPLIITYGDVPFIKSSTYAQLTAKLDTCDFCILGFKPQDKRQYGLLEIKDKQVLRIIDYIYWRDFSAKEQQQLQICNGGIYAGQKSVLLKCLPALANNPHRVMKERAGVLTCVEEYFLTDLVELMQRHALKIGYIIAEDEEEVMGLDDLPALLKAQKIFAASRPE